MRLTRFLYLHRPFSFALSVFAQLAILPVWQTPHAVAQLAEINELSEDEAKQVKIAERFVTVLERSPRRGTALDRVYGHHVEFGTLDKFLEKLRQRVNDQADDGTGWMLLGLFEAHRGEDANAVDAFREAEKYRIKDPLPSYYLGQSLLLMGQPEEAVAAFERAIDRKPRRTDSLEIFRQLGRVHQRAQRTEAALEVWTRLESLFPNDPRVQEQIAITLVEEGEFALALPRYEKLATLVKDDYRRVMFRIEAAELKIRENQRSDGIGDFEKLLANLNPESWLFRDVRRRIEDVFLRAGDQDGLVSYYEKWIEKNKEDVGAMARLAKFLASSARVPEATEWMEKALKLAPSRTDLRKTFIDQLVDDQRYGEAVKQYALLVKSAKGNQDYLRDWGRLVLKDKQVDEPSRKKEAAKIWNQIIAARPKDALTNAQVADLYRQANITDQAIALYKKAIELSPQDPQYREYLGEYYHILKRSDEALAVWKSIAEGDRRNAINVARLAEVYNSFGYLEQAVQEIAEACQLEQKDYALQIKAAEFHNRAGKHDDALRFADNAKSLAATDEERDGALRQRIEIFQSSRRLDEETDLLAEKTSADKSATVEDWHILARYYEAARRWADATDAIETALKKDEKSIPALTTSARIAEMSGDYARAAKMNRQLSDVDRRSRSDHLMNVARLEAQMGKSDEALKAGRDLIVSAPGNTDNYEFYAQLCFQLGKTDEGLDALRKAVRINPTEPHLITALGSALSQQFRADEAIEVYWRAFEKTEEIDDKTSLTTKLAQLYQQIGQFDQLIERFERDRRQEDKRREMTICLAQAHHTSGDFGTARMELESLLNQNTRDTNLLQQLSKLCEGGADMDGAVDYQRQLVAIAPGHETEFRLAKLLQTRGDNDEASDILVRLTRREENPSRLFRSLDSLLRQGSYESVIAITDPLLSEQRDDWELLYREGVAWAKMEKTAEAKDRFRRLLSLNAPHDKLGVAAQAKLKQAQAKARSNNLRGIQSTMPKRQSPMTMLTNSHSIRRAAGLDQDRYYGSQLPPLWTPDAFGLARMAAYAWLIRIDQDENATSDGKDTNKELQGMLDALAQSAASEDATRESIYDWMYVEQIRQNFDSIFQISKRLAKHGGREEQQFYLNSMRLRGVSSTTAQNRSRGQKPEKDPLSEGELELMMSCFESLNKDRSADDKAHNFGGQVIYSSNGQMYVMVGGQWQPVSGVSSMGLGSVVQELKLAGRTEQAEELLENEINSAKTSQQLVAAMNISLEQEQFDRLAELFPKWISLAVDEVAKAPVKVSTGRGRGPSQAMNQLGRTQHVLLRWMAKLGEEEENEQIASILNQSLDLAVEEGKKRRAQQSTRRRRRQQPRSSRNGIGITLYYGKQNFYTRIDYPTPNTYVDMAALTVLREVFEVFKRNDVGDDLPALLRKRVAAAESEKSDTLLYEQLMLGYVLWWFEQQDEAAELLIAAGDQLKDDPAFRLAMASMQETLGNLDEALAIVESITPRDQKLVQQRETMALQLAERLGDIDRARSAAERLFGLRLDNQSQLALIDRMRRLGLLEMAEAVVARVHRRSGNQASSLATLMALYQGQGKVELAQQIAHSLLQRTTSPMRAMANSGRNPFRYNRSGDANRTQALRLLQQTGALAKLTTRLEDQLKRSPDSPRLYEQLIEYYQASNQRDKVKDLLEKAIERRPDAIVLRYQLAKQLEQTGKVAEACDHYLHILDKKPGWVADDFYNVRRVFERSKRSLDLIKAVNKMNLKALGQPYYVIDLVTNMLRGRGADATEENTELAINLFERVFESFPAYRNQMVSQLYDEKLWKNDRVFQLGKRGVIPSPSDAESTPWFGLNNIYSYSSGGTVTAMFHRMVNGIRGTSKTEDLQKAIDAAIKAAPTWKAGHAMLALIELKNNKKKEAKKRLEDLFADQEVLKGMPSAACWIIGQELDQFENTRPIALKLYENAISGNQRATTQLQYSPVTRLVKLYKETGRGDDARKLLLKQLRGNQFNQYDQQYASYNFVENSNWAGKQLLELGFAVDAVRLFRELVNQPERLKQADSWNGRTNYYPVQVRQGMEKALAALNDANAEEAMSRLLALRENHVKGEAVLDLMLMAPPIKEIRNKSMNSQLVDLLTSISKNEEISQGIETRLAKLRNEHPNDLSVAIAQTVFLLRKSETNDEELLKQLNVVVSDNPLDEVAAGRRVNSRQRRQAMASIPLWLVARECLTNQNRQEHGEMLAERALESARRQLKNDHLVAILYDWGKLSLDAGDRQQAEQKWSELLDIVTKRPQSKSKPSARKTSQAVPRGAAQRAMTFANPLNGITAATMGVLAADAPKSSPKKTQLVPPLTISQFRLTVEIALAAAENGMPSLSRKAVKRSLSGGMPVPDPTPSNANQRRVIRTTNQDPNSNPLETEVATALQNILSRWGDSRDYPAAEVYGLLHPIVLPANRPADILLFADSSQLVNAQAKSLGATLVKWANEADAADDFNQRIENRKKNAQSLVAGLVLQTQLAIATKDHELANRRLTELQKAIQDRGLPPMVQLACHAAIPAAKHEPLQGNAFRILKTAVQQQAQATDSRGRSTATIGKLASMVNRHLAEQGDIQGVKAFFDSYLVGRQSHYSRYSGDYGQYLQWRDWASIAEEAAKTGVVDVALDYMGRVTDFEYERYSRPSLTTSLTIAVREMTNRSPAERFKFWQDWTLPNQKRQTIRLLAERVEPVKVPAPFLATSSVDSKHHDGDLLCNFLELIKAADEAGTLEDLRDKVQKAHEKKIDNSEFLLPLVLISMDDFDTAEPHIKDLVKTISKRNKRQNNKTPSFWGDYLVFHACLHRSPEFAKLYSKARTKMISIARSNNKRHILRYIDADYALSEAMVKETTVVAAEDPGLKHWFPATTRSETISKIKPWWVKQENQIAHIAGHGADLLYFSYPLTGEFEFSVDAYRDSWAESDAGYGGLIVESQDQGTNANIKSASGHESFTRKQGLKRGDGMFGRVRIVVKDGKQKYYLNNHLVYEERLRGTSPWITLFTEGVRKTSFRNPAFTGDPTIPREVPLIVEDEIDGWNTSYFNEKQPRKRLMAEKADENSSLAYYQQQEPAIFDWSAKNGIMTATAKSDASESAQSWAYYHRPLQDSESFRYEFEYLPGQSIAHPTIGRLALIIDQGKVKSHWIARPNWDDTILGIPLDNQVDEPDFQREPVELKAHDWNSVVVSRKANMIHVHVNDKLAFQRPLADPTDSRFGFFRYQQQSSKIRNATLTGDWPENLDQGIRGDLLASGPPRSYKDARLINRILGETFFVQDTAQIVARARALPDHKAYRLLKQWVMPSREHLSFRLFFDTPPLQASENTVLSDLQLICPAIELIEVASQMGRLDELQKDVEKAKPFGAAAVRSKNALLTLIAIKKEDDATASRLLSTMFETIVKGLPASLLVHQRAAEFVVAWKAASRPSLQVAAADIAVELRKKERKKSSGGDFKKRVEALVGFTENALAKNEEPTLRNLTQWSLVNYEKPETRARGYRPSTWKYSRGSLRHIPSEMWGQLFFQSPLRGKFEILAERSTTGYGEVSIAYGMHAAEPRYDLKATRVAKVMHSSKDKNGELKIPNWNDKIADFRIVVDDSKITTFTNEVKVHEEILNSAPDPWVVLQTSSPGNASTVRNLRIVGTPTIPDAINLLQIAGWAAWRADMYGDWFTTEGGDEKVPWKRVGEELLGQIRKDRSAEFYESLLMYQRPMLEDGEVEFESYYVPGEFEVHPAIGRLAFLVQPTGVSLHQMTDAQWENDPNLRPDNSTSLDSSTELQLKEKEWNHFKLTVKGDALTIAVNEKDVVTYALDAPRNERFFGLFRYSDKTKCRVRNVVYRGDWPKQLPMVGSQQLAYTSEGPQMLSSDSVFKNEKVIALNRPIEELKSDGLKTLGPADGAVSSEEGIRLRLKNADGYASWPGVSYQLGSTVDFDATVEFRNLNIVPCQEGWGVGFNMAAYLDDPAKSSIEHGIFMTKNGSRYVKSARRHELPNKKNRYDQSQIHKDYTSGSLRIIRKGGEIHCLIAEEGKQFRLVSSFPIGSAAISRIALQNKCSDNVGKVDVTLSRFEFKEISSSENSTISASAETKNRFLGLGQTSTIDLITTQGASLR